MGLGFFGGEVSHERMSSDRYVSYLADNSCMALIVEYQLRGRVDELRGPLDGIGK